MQRLGLCCLFSQEPIRFRTTTARYLSSRPDPHEHLQKIITENLESLTKAINYCHKNGIGAFRISSKLFPVYTHPQHGYQIDDLPEFREILTSLKSINALAKELDIRLTFHPDQFVVLNSPSSEVVHKSINDLEYHGLLADLIGADVINIHAGGGYGDKIEALKRFRKNFQMLSPQVQSKLTIENDDRVYTPKDLLPVCKDLEIPLVYDVHHHKCLPDKLNIEKATEKSLTTWNREPLFHISSPKEGWSGPKPRSHHDFINLEDMPSEWLHIDPLTIDIEAKAKEIAVIRLKTQLKKQGWNFK